MNIVTMCRGGNVRSVAAKMILQRYLGHEVIAIGADNTSDETKKFLFDWADKIVVMNKEFLPYLEHHNGNSIFNLTKIWDFKDKSILLDVGNDVWGDPFHEELQIEIADRLNGIEYRELTNSRPVPLLTVLETIRAYKRKIKERNTADSAV